MNTTQTFKVLTSGLSVEQLKREKKRYERFRLNREVYGIICFELSKRNCV